MLWSHCGYDMDTIDHDAFSVLSSMIWMHGARRYGRHAVLIWVPWGRAMCVY